MSKNTHTKNKPGSALEARLLKALADNGFPAPKIQHKLSPQRKWRVDLVWESLNIAVEVQGGTWIAGRHSRGPGARSDAEKLNYSAVKGWRTLYVTSDMVSDGTALDWIWTMMFSGPVMSTEKALSLLDNRQFQLMRGFMERRQEFYGGEHLSSLPVLRYKRKKRARLSASKSGAAAKAPRRNARSHKGARRRVSN